MTDIIALSREKFGFCCHYVDFVSQPHIWLLNGRNVRLFLVKPSDLLNTQTHRTAGDQILAGDPAPPKP